MWRRVLLALILALVSASAAGAEWHLAWVRHLPARKPMWEFTPRMLRDTAHVPVVQEDLVLLGCEHNGALLALDLQTGSERWRFYTNGAIRFAPVASARAIYVVSDDGYLYALDQRGRLERTPLE